MLSRLLGRSLVQRKSRVAVAILAVVMGAAMVTALLSVSWDMEKKLATEARKFGANIMLLPQGDALFNVAESGGIVMGDRFIRDSDIAKIERENIIGAAPYLYGVVEVNGKKAVLAGTRPDEAQKVSPWWKIEGQWPKDIKSAVIGAKVAGKLKIKIGDNLIVRTEGKRVTDFMVSGILRAGGPEDNQVYLLLPAAQQVLNRPGQVSLVQVSAMTDKKELGEVVRELEQAVPGSKGKAVKQLANAELNLLTKIRWLMILVTVAVLVASVLSVMSTMTSTVLERRKEIGIMKALGAENRKIARLFFSEAAIIGISGGVTGYVAGLMVSQVIGKSVFATFISIRPVILPLTIAVALAVALVASRGPIRQALKIDPIITLRGE